MAHKFVLRRIVTVHDMGLVGDMHLVAVLLECGHVRVLVAEQIAPRSIRLRCNDCVVKDTQKQG